RVLVEAAREPERRGEDLAEHLDAAATARPAAQVGRERALHDVAQHGHAAENADEVERDVVRALGVHPPEDGVEEQAVEERAAAGHAASSGASAVRVVTGVPAPGRGRVRQSHQTPTNGSTNGT